MAHYAKVDNGKVVKVIVADADFFKTFVDDSPGEWIKTSYNTSRGKHWTTQKDGTKVESKDQSKALRKNYAGIGFIYDKDRDAFYEPQPYPSWTLDEDSCVWMPPVEYPGNKDGKSYEWDEGAKGWNVKDGFE